MLVKVPGILLSVCLIKSVLALSHIPRNKERHANVQEVTNVESKCYTQIDLTRILREILIFIQQNPHKTKELHHLIDFLSHEGDVNDIQDAVQEIVENSGMFEERKNTLRSRPNYASKPDIKTQITFKYEVPSLDQPQCKDVFMSLMEIAHDAYMRLVKYPTCQPKPDESNYYDKSNGAQPYIQGLPDLFNPDPYTDRDNEGYFSDRPSNNFNIPKNPNNVDDFLKLLPNQTNQFDWLNPYDSETVQNNFKEPEYYDSNIKPFYDLSKKKKVNDFIPEEYTLPSEIEHFSPSDKDVFNGKNPENLISPFKVYGNMNPNIISYLNSLLEKKENVPQGETQVINPENVNSPEIIKYLLPLILQHKNTDPKIKNVLITLLVDNPKLKDLILSHLRLNNNDDSNVDDGAENKYQILFSLLKPNGNGVMNPKLIETIKYLSKINENSTPNYKIIHHLIPFLKPNGNNLAGPKNIDTLLHFLRMNKNRTLPDDIYYKIIMFLTQISDKNNYINDNFDHPIQEDLEINPLKADNNLLPLILDKNPYLLSKLLPNHPIPIPNQITPNNNGVIEFTYLLKQPQPLIYDPYYYVKYRLPLSTFVSNVKHLLLKNPQLSSKPEKLYQELIKISNVTDVSPKLQDYSKNEIVKLTFKDGTLVAAKLVNNEDNNMKDEIKMIQDLNSDVRPEDILEQANKISSQNNYNKDSQLNSIVGETVFSPYDTNVKQVQTAYRNTPLISAEKKINPFIYNRPNGIHWTYGQNRFLPMNRVVNSRFQVPDYEYKGPYYNYQFPNNRHQFPNSRFPVQYPGLRYRNPGGLVRS